MIWMQVVDVELRWLTNLTPFPQGLGVLNHRFRLLLRPRRALNICDDRRHRLAVVFLVLGACVTRRRHFVIRWTVTEELIYFSKYTLHEKKKNIPS